MNKNGTVALDPIMRNRQARMAAYDALPSKVRKLLQDAPYSISVDDVPALSKSDKANRATLTRVARESARATYGNSYPVDLIKF